MPTATYPLSLLSLILTGALFGFFYAWVCSTMWGLDQADPRVAIAAMQAMNASVRNAVFAPVFFGTPVVLFLTALVLWRSGQSSAWPWMAGAALLVIALSFVLTMAVNVPMNEALAVLEVPSDVAEARTIWQDYSPTWQLWNQLRTISSGCALLLVGVALFRLQ